MKFNNRSEIKNILEMNITNEEKKNLIANIKNIKTDLARIISVDYELELKVGDIWDNRGQAASWSDMNEEIRNTAFTPELGGETEYVLIVENVEGYKVQYLGFDNIFDELYHNQDFDEDTADEIAYKVSSDEVYVELMSLLGNDGDMNDEAEVLVPAEAKFEIAEINDGREDIGYIEIILKEVK